MAIVLIVALLVLIFSMISISSDRKRLEEEKTNVQNDLSDVRRELTEANRRYDSLKKQYDATSNEYTEFRTTIEKANTSIEKLTAEKQELEKEIALLTTDSLIASYTLSSYDSISSEECKDKLALLKIDEQALIKEDKATTVSFFPADSAERKIATNNKKQILRCFNAECDNQLTQVSVKNIDSSRSKIQKSFETLNKIFEVDGLSLSKKLLEIKLEELNLTYTYALKKEQEKEEQKAIKAQMLEEEKVRREIEREKAKIDKEESQFRNEITKLMKYLQKASDIEKQLYVDKINELEEKLKLLEKDKENVLEREQNTRAGFVYVISNIGSFGENVYKIGMTRRLEPMDRIKELGDASVPFEFDVHAMIFSEDAPQLEHILHETFRAHQINKVNNRKEFFRVPLEDVAKVVKENHNATVTFTMIAKAEQYRESLRLEESAV